MAESHFEEYVKLQRAIGAAGIDGCISVKLTQFVVAQARREFDNASREFQKVSAGIQNGTSPFLQPSSPAQAAAPAAALSQASQPGTSPAALPQPAVPASSGKTGDQLLIEAAEGLGIPTGGKTREQNPAEIIAMAQRPSSSGDSLPPPAGDSPP